MRLVRFVAIIGGTVGDIVFRDVNAIVINLTNASEGASETQLADLDGDCSTLHRRLAHVTKCAQLILNDFWVDVFVTGTIVEDAQCRPEHNGEKSKDADERPEDVDVGDNTETKRGQRVLLHHIFVAHIVFLLFLRFLGNFFASDGHSVLFA